jgi:Tfp pilus assembly protein PilZ
MCFEIPTRVSVGDEVVVAIHLSRGKDESPILCKCKVVWNDGAGAKHRHGGQFTSFEDGGRERFDGWLKKA